jgi:excisionase family DNA binding protein
MLLRTVEVDKILGGDSVGGMVLLSESLGRWSHPMPLNSPEPLLTVRETADRLRVNPETVRRWLRAGRLKGILMGGDRGGYRIPASELERLTQSGLRQNPDDA